MIGLGRGGGIPTGGSAVRSDKTRPKRPRTCRGFRTGNSATLPTAIRPRPASMPLRPSGETIAATGIDCRTHIRYTPTGGIREPPEGRTGARIVAVRSAGVRAENHAFRTGIGRLTSATKATVRAQRTAGWRSRSSARRPTGDPSSRPNHDPHNKPSKQRSVRPVSKRRSGTARADSRKCESSPRHAATPTARMGSPARRLPPGQDDDGRDDEIKLLLDRKGPEVAGVVAGRTKSHAAVIVSIKHHTGGQIAEGHGDQPGRREEADGRQVAARGRNESEPPPAVKGLEVEGACGLFLAPEPIADQQSADGEKEFDPVPAVPGDGFCERAARPGVRRHEGLIPVAKKNRQDCDAVPPV